MFSFAILVALVLVAGHFLITDNADENLFLNLSRLIGAFVVIFYVLFSAGIYLAKRVEKSRPSSAASARVLTSVTPEGKWAWLFKKHVSFKPRMSRSLLNSILLLGIGCSITLYGVHVFFESDPSNMDRRRVNTTPLMPVPPPLVYLFKSGRSGSQDIGVISTPAYSMPGAGYSDLQMRTASAFRREYDKGTLELVEVTGYADVSGTTKFNQKLSAERAETVRTLLIAAGAASNDQHTCGQCASAHLCTGKGSSDRSMS